MIAFFEILLLDFYKKSRSETNQIGFFILVLKPAYTTFKI